MLTQMLMLQPKLAIEARQQARLFTDALGEASVRQAIGRQGSFVTFKSYKPANVAFEDETTVPAGIAAVLRRVVQNDPTEQVTTYVIFLTSVSHYQAPDNTPENNSIVLTQVLQAIDAAAYVTAPNPLAVIFTADLVYPTRKFQDDFELAIAQAGVWQLRLPFTRKDLVDKCANRRAAAALIQQFASYVYITYVDKDTHISASLSHYQAYNLFSIVQKVRETLKKTARHNAVIETLEPNTLAGLALSLNALSINEKLAGGQLKLRALLQRMSSMLIADDNNDQSDTPAHIGLHDYACI